MPVHRCEEDGKPGWQYGSQKCYTYDPDVEGSEGRARHQAEAQAAAIEHAGGGDQAPRPAGKPAAVPLVKRPSLPRHK